MKKRLDEILIEQGFFSDIKLAKSIIMSGYVIVNDKKIDKPGTIIKREDSDKIRLKNINLKYVGRGGFKLEAAIKNFDLDFKDKFILDIGASTGGFTDCALQHGANFVYAMDVGTNQLAWKLRSNEKVKSIENTHIYDLNLEQIENQKIDFILIDVSFISIKSIFPHLIRFFSDNTKLVLLIKPQFELKKELLEKGGIVKNISYHEMIILDVIASANENNIFIEKLDISPIKGNKGNIEYLSLFSKSENVNKDIKLKNVLKKAINLGGFKYDKTT